MEWAPPSGVLPVQDNAGGVVISVLLVGAERDQVSGSPCTVNLLPAGVDFAGLLGEAARWLGPARCVKVFNVPAHAVAALILCVERETEKRQPCGRQRGLEGKHPVIHRHIHRHRHIQTHRHTDTQTHSHAPPPRIDSYTRMANLSIYVRKQQCDQTI